MIVRGTNCYENGKNENLVLITGDVGNAVKYYSGKFNQSNEYKRKTKIMIFCAIMIVGCIVERSGKMSKIVWKGIIKSESDFPTSDIPTSAKKLDSEEDMIKMQVKALPFMIPSILICFICIFIKTFIANEKVINVGGLFIGVVIGFLLIFVHELLHAVAFPKDATVYIGIMPKSLTAVALSSCPVKRNRFVFLSILPIILGLVPLVIFCFSSSDLKQLNGILFGMSIMGMVSVYPDIYNVFNILKVVPKNAIIQNNKNSTYYFE